jgi:hypothetical protein
VETLVTNAIAEGRLQLEEVNGAFVEQTQAAGFRQRREGLAYRLTWHKKGVRPIKRVAPDSATIASHRKVIYRMRFYISSRGERIFSFARKVNMPKIYIWWARITASIYHGLAYHQGNKREMLKRFKGFKG